MDMTWNWIAGFFEGEGNISWLQGKRGTKQGTSGRVVIGQNDKRPLIAIKCFLEGVGFEHILLYVRPANPKRRRPNPIWILGINQRDEVIKFLECIAPLLFEKQAKVVDISNRLKRLRQEREDVLVKALALRQNGNTWKNIRKSMHINYRTLTNYARSKGIKLKIEPFNFLSWRHERIERGLCVSCGKKRGVNGTKIMCRICANKSNLRTKEWKRKQRLSTT